MTFRNPMGSMSALSLAANPAALPVLATAAGVAVTVAAATFAYKAYKHYEEKKMKDEIMAINHLHDKHLAKIFIPDNSEIKGFPPIFKFDPEKPAEGVDSMHFTDDQIDDIGKNIPRSTDIILTNYRQSIQNAILKLKDYYYSRSDHHDLSSGVICYLLYILDTKCLTFEGYEYDIAYLDAITNFINAYSSLKDRENSQTFSRLAPVYAYLLTAQQDLQRHKDSMSLEEMVGELRDTCINQSKLLLRCLTKMATDEKDWDLVRFVTEDELQKGILRRKYIKSEIKGLVLRSDAIVNITDSPYKDWVSTLADYYLQTIDPDSKLYSHDIISPNSLFVIPPYEKLESLRANKQKLTAEETKAYKRLEDDYKLALKYFATCKNFLTSQLDPRTENSTPKYKPIDNAVDIKARSIMIAQFATLVHQVISLQFMSVNLLKSIKQLGEIYVKSPNNFRQVFNVFSILCKDIKAGIDQFRQNMTAIQNANKNTMQLEDQEIFPEQIKHIFDVTYAKVSRLDRSIKEYRDRVPKDKNSPTIESVKHEMFEVAAKLSKCYDIPIGPESADEVIEAVAAPTPILTEIKLISAAPATITVKDLLNRLSNMNNHLKAIGIALPALGQPEKDIYTNLITIRDNAAILLNRLQDPVTDNDAIKLFTLLEDLASRMHNFTALTKTERAATLKTFTAYMADQYSELKTCKSFDPKPSKNGMFAKRNDKPVKMIDELCKEMNLSMVV